ncbi:hypothetical protein, partial [Vibrio sp. DNB22_19_2]
VLLLARRQLGRPADSHDIDALAANEEHPAANWLVVCPGAPAELATTLAAAIAGANPADGSSRVALVDSPEAALAHAALDDTAV